MIRAVFGGSFDPVHAGHVAVVERVLAAGLAAVVHVVPAWLSPHKSAAGAPPSERLALARLAFAAVPGATVDDREVRAGAPCRTVHTLAALAAEHAGDRFRLVIGADNLPGFRTWAEPDRLLDLAELVVFARSGVAADPAAVAAAGLPPDRVLTVPDFHEPVSSTEVRAMLAAAPDRVGTLVAGGLPETVAARIVARRLYRTDRNGEHRVPDPD